MSFGRSVAVLFSRSQSAQYEISTDMQSVSICLSTTTIRIVLQSRDVVLGTCNCTPVVLEYSSRVLVLVLTKVGLLVLVRPWVFIHSLCHCHILLADNLYFTLTGNTEDFTYRR